ncbi:MAG TPA: MerR family transcriptional regulator [Kofleriaceae bacterium]
MSTTTWTLPELVAEAARRIAALPAPKNGQVRAVPDERTIRYYAALGLLDRPAAMKGRVGLYGARHLAQVVAIKRLQSSGKSLAEIEALWPTLDDGSLSRMTGVAIEKRSTGARAEFWKKGPRASDLGPRTPDAEGPKSEVRSPRSEVPLLSIQARLELAPGVTLLLAPPPHLSPSDLRAIRAAAEPLIAELARRSSMEES